MKLACVVHRYGADIAGGSEAHCRHIAERLAERHDVTVLTSCAKDHITWRNEYPTGESRVGPVTVRRFPVARQRSLNRFRTISDIALFAEHRFTGERWQTSAGLRETFTSGTDPQLEPRLSAAASESTACDGCI